MSRPNLLQLDIWGKHVKHALEVLSCALLKLKHEKELPLNEDKLNRKLLSLIKKENHRLAKCGRGCSSPIVYECRNQPIENSYCSSDEIPASYETKRPDFIWGLVDLIKGQDLFFAIECKRLGIPTSQNWILTKNYIVNGVKRYLDVDHGYGIGASDGAMIGYLQSMSGQVALNEVNNYANDESIPFIEKPASWKKNGLTQLNQTLNRVFPQTPFKLSHIWIDIRKP